MLGRTDSRLRLVALLLVFGVIATLLGVRLAYWQLGQGPDLRQIASTQLQRPDSGEEVRRGDITDRRGDVLATTAYRDLLAAYPDLMSDGQRDQTAAGLAAILGTRPPQQRAAAAQRLRQRARKAFRTSSSASSSARRRATRCAPAWPATLLPRSGSSRIRSASTRVPGARRERRLASQLLGFVTQDGEGRYGVEQASQAVLAGAGSATADATDNAPLPQTGGSVQLTIDASLQLRLEKELSRGLCRRRAPRVTGVVMDPYTGAILAWGSVPGYDENDYASVAQDAPDLFADPIASEVYEPGSVMKMLTAAAALEQGVVTLTTPVEDQKALVFGNTVVKNFDKKSMGATTVRRRDRSLAQRRRGQDSTRARRDDGRCVGRAVRHVAPARHRRADGHRAGQRVGGPGYRSVRPTRGIRSISSTTRSGRAWRSRRCS